MILGYFLAFVSTSTQHREEGHRARVHLLMPQSATSVCRLLVLLSCSWNSAAASVPADGAGIVVRYFAYGANLASTVREGRRQLRPLSTACGFVKDSRLAFNMPGFGPAEPSFASLRTSPGQECHGGIFELTLSDWLKLCASEGVPFGYAVREVQVELYAGGSVSAFTLVGGLPFDLPPSERYLSLIREGARELGLTAAYQERLSRVQTAPFGSRPAVRAKEFEQRPGSTFL